MFLTNTNTNTQTPLHMAYTSQNHYLAYLENMERNVM
jgi:hypothetical protein